ncbi:putative nucleotidyltransferase substrate binding domain-containing protein [Candidatus Neptunochlamydia vexilliferae]|uniref:putative nucleotidyltransferase substrate binding domain-containing protein n=1 Tax=Candidatus Neptunichlamydia vexilliferae TaxID=1651774 RepID=UPI00189137F6|nr:putative nucleotidyltransferase substrate binding domain-containing protein [Candidatus Neptunochlamydia vexilliferae]
MIHTDPLYSSSSSSSTSCASPNSLLSRIEKAIQEKKYEKGVDYLGTAILSHIKEREISTLYKGIFLLTPNLSEPLFAKLTATFGDLFTLSSEPWESQMKLAEVCGDKQLAIAKGKKERYPYFSTAMHYYAKAIQISKKHSCKEIKALHQKISQLPLNFAIQQDLFRGRLEQSKLSPDRFAKDLKAIDIFKERGFPKQLIEQLYETASSVLNELFRVDKERRSGFRHCATMIENGLSGYVLSKSPTIWSEGVHSNFDHLRTNFLNHKNGTLASIPLFQKHFFQEVFLILGEPPCQYDFRAMGSMAREEMCPYSDLEWFILIEHKMHTPYFQRFIELLELLIISLGETTTTGIPVFTSLGLKHPSGFHLDTPPDNISLLIATPDVMAQHIAGDDTHYEPNSLQNTLLKSLTLSSNSDLLFKDFHTKIQKTLNKPYAHPNPDIQMIREKRAMKLFTKRLKDYREAWPEGFPSILNIKEQFVQPLFHLLSDLALYFDCPSKNTLEVIKELEKKGVFHAESSALLRKTVEEIYQIRVRLHLNYGEQKEVTSLDPNLDTITLTSKEKQALTCSYYLVIKPLYTLLQKTRPSFRKRFNRARLINLSFEGALVEESRGKAQLQEYVNYLLKMGVPNGLHEKRYRLLSQKPQLESLRAAYLDALSSGNNKNLTSIVRVDNPSFLATSSSFNQKKIQARNSHFETTLIHKLALIPNRDGTRQSVIREEHAFWASLQYLTQTHPSPAKITFPNQPTTYFKEEFRSQVFDPQGNIKKQYSGSLHNVARLKTNTLDLHIKQKPSHPLMEYATYNLISRIAGEGTPPTLLARLEVKGRPPYPLLISKTIPGENLKAALRKKLDLDDVHFSWMLLTTLLLRPGDARAVNYILKDKKLYSIDNDIAFVSPIVRSNWSTTVHFCSILFCLNPTFQINPRVSKAFTQLDPDFILKSWIQDLEKKEKEYLSLFSLEERKRLYEEDKENQFTPTLLFRQGEMATLYTQFKHLQQVLKKNPQIPALKLLSSLINLRTNDFSTSSIGPRIERAYTTNTQDPEDRLKQATGRRREKSQTTPQAMRASLGRVPKIEEIENQKAFSITKAKQELFAYPISKIARTTKQGIEVDFSAMTGDLPRQELLLESLKQIFPRGSLASLRLLNCEALTEQTLDPFLHPQLKILDLRCSGLRNLNSLAQKAPNLQEVYLSGSKNLETFESGGTLFSGPVELPHLRELHIARCPQLNSVRIKSDFLKVFKANKNSNLKLLELDLYWLDSMDLSKTPGIDKIHCQQNIANKRAKRLSKGMQDLGNQKIIKVIKESKLERINFSYAPLDLKSVKVLADLLKNNRSLTQLDLWHTSLTKKAIQPLMDALRLNSTLKSLNLAGSDISIEYEKTIYKKLQKNRRQVKHIKNGFFPSCSSSSSTSSLSIALASSRVIVPTPKIAFGVKEWRKYFGFVGDAPSLPYNIEEILNSPCPIWNDKIVKETHLLTLIPQTINGSPLTINTLETIIQKPLVGDNTSKYQNYPTYIKKGLGDQKVPYSYWVLVSRDVIPNSHKKNYSSQSEIFKELTQRSRTPYIPPKAIELAVTILMEYCRSGKRLYTNYTRCRDKVDNRFGLHKVDPVTVGDFSSSGLVFRHDDWFYIGTGIAASRRFY